MTSTTTTAPTTPTTLEQRDETVARWHAADAAMRAAQSTERGAPKPSAAHTLARKERLSQGAKKANRIHEIRQLELDLRIEGTEFTPFVEPEAPASPSRLLPMTQAEIETKLAAVRKLRGTLRTGIEDSVIHDCDVRIKALLVSAEKRGYKVA